VIFETAKETTMARTPSMTALEAETAIGLRGSITVNADNRGLVRKWFVAQGLPALFVGGLSMRELQYAYNDTSGNDLEKLRRKLAETANDIGAENEPVALATPVPAPRANGHDTGIEAAIRAIAASVVPQSTTIDETAVREIVAQEMAKQTPRQVIVKVNDAPAVLLNERTHPSFERILRLIANGANVLLVGPAGCGKTHLAQQIATALNRKYGAIHGSAGASESQLTGWLLPSDGGKFVYTPSLFVNLYESGESIFLWDEIDAFDPNMLLVANGALANGHLYVAHRTEAPCVRRGPNVGLMATANTYGTGANPMYSSRNSLDAATLDRFVVVTLDYDRDLESDLAQSGGLTTSEIADVWRLRDNVRDKQLRRTISTRAIQKAAIMKASGDNWQTVMSTLVEGWTKDERAKVGV
jgi:cobaltochelatase CobS